MDALQHACDEATRVVLEANDAVRAADSALRKAKEVVEIAERTRQALIGLLLEREGNQS